MNYTLEKAVELIRLWEPQCAAAGYHLGLTGSTLFRGTSEKDFDFLLYPHDPSKPADINSLRDLLDSLGIKVWYPTDRAYVNRDVLICSYDDYRIDFFIEIS